MSYIEKPRLLWWRKLIFQIHLIVGVGIGLYVFLIGVTGASLVFRDEMEHFLYRDIVRAGDRTANPDPVTFAQNFRRAYPDRQLSSLFMPSDDHPSVIAYLQKDEHYLAVFASADGRSNRNSGHGRNFLALAAETPFDLLAGVNGTPCQRRRRALSPDALPHRRCHLVAWNPKLEAIVSCRFLQEVEANKLGPPQRDRLLDIGNVGRMGDLRSVFRLAR